MQDRKPPRRPGRQGEVRTIKSITIKENGKETEVWIDGVKMENIYRFTIQKEPDSTIKVELSGRVKEVRVET